MAQKKMGGKVVKPRAGKRTTGAKNMSVKRLKKKNLLKKPKSAQKEKKKTGKEFGGKKEIRKAQKEVSAEIAGEKSAKQGEKTPKQGRYVKAVKRPLSESSNEDRTPRKRVSFASSHLGKTLSEKTTGSEPRSILKRKDQQEESSVDDVEPTTSKDESTVSVRERLYKRKGKDARDNLLLKKKELREQRRKRKLKKNPMYALTLKAVRLWETVRNRKSSPEDRLHLTDELYRLVSGQAVKLIYSHSGARVIQCLMAIKNADIRSKLFEELKGEIMPMSKNRYSRFFVLKMIKYGGPSQRQYILDQFKGHFVELLRHAYASEVVQFAYNQYANAAQRQTIVSEFYGPEYALLEDKSQPLSALPEEKRTPIMKHLTGILSALTTKTVLKHTLVHRLFAEFFTLADANQRSEMVDLLKERAVEMANTKDGALVAMHCVWFGNAKDRKVIVKTLKTLVCSLCCNEHGYAFILAILDSIDDTVLLRKTVLKEIQTDYGQLLDSKYGLKVLNYLTAHRDRKCLYPELLHTLEKGDQNPFTKKAPVQRLKELLEFIGPSLVEHVASNLKSIILDKQKCLLVANLVLNYDGDVSAIFNAIGRVCAEEFVPCRDETYHIVEHAQGHFVLQILLKNDPERVKNGKVTLTETILEMVNEDQLRSWTACNKGCFVLLKMLESSYEPALDRIKSATQTARRRLKSYSFKSAKLLLSKME